MADISDLIGKTLVGCRAGDAEIVFICDDKKEYRLIHYQECCEHVRIEDIEGDLNDLVGSPILKAEEVISPEGEPEPDESEYLSWTWTFYKFATIKGYVTIRWLGQTREGYYSENVHFILGDMFGEGD